MRIHLIAVAVFSVLAVFSPRAEAHQVPARGFTDLAPGYGSVLSNMLWMKNRQVTLGCTSTLYCPATPWAGCRWQRS